MNKLKKVLKRLIASSSPPLPSSMSSWEEILLTDVMHYHSAKGTAKKILCATSVGSHQAVTCVDSLVAMGLWVRGAEPEFLLCDEVLPACEAAMFYNLASLTKFIESGPRDEICKDCFVNGNDFYEPLPLPINRYSQFVTGEEIDCFKKRVENLDKDECFQFEDKGLSLGEQTRAGTLRFFGKADIDTEDPQVVKNIAQRYLQGAMTTALVAERIIEKIRPECIVAHHGVYVPQGVLGLVARKKGVRVVNWGPSYRNTTVIYSHGDTYHRTFMYEPTSNWENRELSPDENKKLDEYLRLRRDGKGDWSWVTPERGAMVSHEQHQLGIAIGLDFSKPVYGLLTNVLWDAQLYYSNSAFTNMLDWLYTTLDFFIEHPELQLIVRIHPHEIKQGNRQPTRPEIDRRYKTLPKNIIIIDHGAPYSTYALMDLCQAVLIYGTKTGVELAPFGQPVITAGEAWIRNKGITYDAHTRDEYLNFLQQLPVIAPLTLETVERARRYAYHYFFRRMIPIKSLDPDASYPPRLRISSLDDILPGKDAGLDVVCDGILNDKEFIYDN